MLLSLLLIFLKTLDGVDFETIFTDDKPSLKPNVHFKDTSSGDSTNGELPPLVPLVFPDQLYENGATDVLGVVEKKLEDFFGETMASEIMKINSSDGVFDYLSKADFHSFWINSIVNNVAGTLKSKQIPLTKINTKKKCRKTCKNNHSTVMSYLQSSIENVISTMTKEDFRFEFSQDPKKSYSFTFDKDMNQYICKCTDEGYMIKVSPRLKQLMEEKYLKKENGKPLSELILEDHQKTHLSDLMSWGKMMNLGLYLTGWKSKAKRDTDDDIGEFIVYHGMIAFLLFIFCHCFFYIYLIYVLFLFVNDFVL